MGGGGGSVIGKAGTVVLFDAYLEPVAAALAGLISTLAPVQHLDHEPLARRLDALVQEQLDLVQLLAIHVGRKGKLALYRRESLVEQRPALLQRPFHKRLSVQVQQVKGEHANLDLDVLNLHVLLLARHQLLERQHLLVNHIPGNRLAVHHKALGFVLHPRVQLGKNVRVLLGQVF